MTKKAIFLDLDNTLYCHEIYKIPESALLAIEKAKENGHYVFLCTGRNPSMGRIVDSTLFDAVIFSSGSYIKCNDQLLFESYFEQSEIGAVFDFCNSGKIEVNLETPNAVYLSENSYQIFSTNQHRDISPEADVVKIENLKKLSEYQGQLISKIPIFTKEEKYIHELATELSNCINPIGKIRYRRELYTVELTQKGLNKATGIQVVLDHFRVKRQDTIAIGDGVNDFEMLDYCNIGICVEDGDEELKKKADDICPSPLEDGIYYIFKKLGLIS